MAGRWGRYIAPSSTIPYRPSILMYKVPMPFSAYTRLRQGTGSRAGRPIRPSKPPPFAQRGSWNVWVVNNYQSLSRALNVWTYPSHHNVSMSPECDSPIVWHPGTQLTLGQRGHDHYYIAIIIFSSLASFFSSSCFSCPFCSYPPPSLLP